MLAGLVVFVLGKKALNGAGEAPAPLTKSKEMTLYGIGLASVAVIWALVQYQDVIQGLLVVSGVSLLGYVLYESFKLDKEPRERMFAILFLISLNPLQFPFGRQIITLAPTLSVTEVVTVAVLVVGMAVLASLQPAWRASRMDPIQALRHV